VVTAQKLNIQFWYVFLNYNTILSLEKKQQHKSEINYFNSWISSFKISQYSDPDNITTTF